jgi:predicted O-methyltransferase YrrM
MNKPEFANQPWFWEKFRHLSERYNTQKLALTILNQLTDKPFILETGCIRLPDDWGAGMSTLLFGEYVSRHGGHVTTVDNSEVNMMVCQEITKEFEKYITYVVSDSLAYLPTVTEKIDLLYLDSYDCPIEGDASAAQEHNLREFKYCERNLNERAVIMIDDVGFANGGKGAKTHEYLIQQGYLLLFKHQQSVWLK